MYKALIVPCFDCSSCAWEYIGKGLSKKLQKLQNRAARIMTLSNNETRFKDLLDRLGLEVLEDRRIRQFVIIMYKITHNISPLYDECLWRIHSYNLRNSSVDLYVLKPKIEIGKHSLNYRGSVLWNKLPIEAREQESLDLFKSFYRDNAFCEVIYNNCVFAESLN